MRSKMGRTYRKEKSWDDGYRSGSTLKKVKKKAKEFRGDRMKTLNSNDPFFEGVDTKNHTTKRNIDIQGDTYGY